MTAGRQGGAAALAEPAVVRAPDRVAIRTRELKKNYGTVEAVRGINLEVHEGEIFGLIGPDGAGKTSTFQILALASWKPLPAWSRCSASPPANRAISSAT